MLRNEKECDLDRRELELRKQQDALKDQRIANLEKELELARQEIGIKDKIIAVKDMEIAAQQRAITDLKDISDRAIKLAETSKPKAIGNWELLGIIGVVAFVAGLAIGL